MTVDASSADYLWHVLQMEIDKKTIDVRGLVPTKCDDGVAMPETT